MALSLLVESEQPSAYDKKSAEGNGWSIHSIPIAENLAPSLDQIHEFMARLTGLPKGTKVLVFCQSGRGRTACMGAAYWIAKGLTTSAAIDLMSEGVEIQHGRPRNDGVCSVSTKQFSGGDKQNAAVSHRAAIVIPSNL